MGVQSGHELDPLGAFGCVSKPLRALGQPHEVNGRVLHRLSGDHGESVEVLGLRLEDLHHALPVDPQDVPEGLRFVPAACRRPVGLGQLLNGVGRLHDHVDHGFAGLVLQESVGDVHPVGVQAQTLVDLNLTGGVAGQDVVGQGLLLRVGQLGDLRAGALRESLEALGHVVVQRADRAGFTRGDLRQLVGALGDARDVVDDTVRRLHRDALIGHPAGGLRVHLHDFLGDAENGVEVLIDAAQGLEALDGSGQRGDGPVEEGTGDEVHGRVLQSGFQRAVRFVHREGFQKGGLGDAEGRRHVDEVPLHGRVIHEGGVGPGGGGLEASKPGGDGGGDAGGITCGGDELGGPHPRGEAGAELDDVAGDACACHLRGADVLQDTEACCPAGTTLGLSLGHQTNDAVVGLAAKGDVGADPGARVDEVVCGLGEVVYRVHEALEGVTDAPHNSAGGVDLVGHHAVDVLLELRVRLGRPQAVPEAASLLVRSGVP
ncbi:Uncharacterised protein [Brevundimonas diminuta]|nr:Uncharacterised protein [Brevundimonas diminuta]